MFNQTVSSGLMIFFLLITLLPNFELVLLQEIKKLINLESANFKLDPELSPLNDHTLIPCRTINIFFFHFIQRSDKSEENEDSKVNRKEEYENGREKGRKRKWECQPSHNRAAIKEKKGRPPRIKV